MLARSCASSHMRPVAWQPAVQLESAATRYQPDEGGGGGGEGGGDGGSGDGHKEVAPVVGSHVKLPTHGMPS